MHTSMPTYVCIYSCVDVHSHMYMHAHARDFSTTRIQQCLHVCVCLCVCVFMCVCVFVRTCCMHVHMSECMYVNQQPDKQVCIESASMNWKTRVIQLTRSEQVIAPIRARHHPTPVTTTSSA